ncbi:desmoplakin [Patella vulgata]|uniref:desmoplakin n=1 Tax=Patella vulgata TaxID=6465 RepID=UPI0024A8B921|nr:desmoplakin [Patella vulgata]
MLAVDSFMPEISFMGEVKVDVPEVNMGKPKLSESMLCESCKNNLDTESVPCTCPRSPDELKHSTSIRENKENQKQEMCPIRMAECGHAKADDSENIETEQLQKAESNLKAELQCSDTQESILPIQSSERDQPKEQVVDVKLLQTGYNKLADENRELKERLEKLEKLEKEKKSSEDEGSKVLQTIPLIEQQGKMLEEDYSKIRNNIEFLMEELDPDVLITALFSKCVLTEDDVEELDKIAESSKQRCVRQMLMRLLRRGQDAYKKFLKCLELKGYWQAIKRLEPDSVRYKSHIKYPGETLIELIDSSNPHRKEFINEVEDNIEGLYPESTEFVIVIKLAKGCVQVTFSLISLNSNKSESELRQILETAVKSGYIGRKKVSTEGFIFEKVEEGDEPTSMPEQHNIQNQFTNLKRKLKDTEEDNSNLRKKVSELVDECKKAKTRQEEVESGDEPISTMEQQGSENQFTNLKRKLKDTEEDNSNLRKQVKELENECKKLQTHHLEEVESGLPYVEPTAIKDEFPLHHAALYATDIEEFKSVLEKQASKIRQLDKDGDTPLDKACLSQYCPIEKVKLIVYKGYTDAETLVAICRAAPKSLLRLIFCIPMKDKLDESVIRAMTELRKQLMDGDDIDARTHSDKTLLHFASEYCDIEAMSFLIEHDSDVRSIDTDGASPMFYSCKSDNDPVQKINLLEAHGAIIESKPIFNKTLLHTACEFSTLTAVVFLIEQEGLDVNGQDSYGKSPLYYSCKSDKQPIEKIDFLKSKGASLKCSTIDNYTLLHAACDYNTAEVVEHLIELGLDVESEDIYRYTPLHCCCRSPIDPIDKIKKLADHGARFLIKFRREYIGIASKFDLTDTVDFLKRSLPENVVPEAANEGENAMDVPVPAEQIAS